jgi:hypothetical protein
MAVGNAEPEHDLNQVTVVVMPNSRVVLDKQAAGTVYPQETRWQACLSLAWEGLGGGLKSFVGKLVSTLGVDLGISS